eukprot:jgi/Picre1/28426/NNA_003830.t1
MSLPRSRLEDQRPVLSRSKHPSWGGADGGFIRISMNYLKPDQVRNPDSLLGRKSTKRVEVLFQSCSWEQSSWEEERWQ